MAGLFLPAEVFAQFVLYLLEYALFATLRFARPKSIKIDKIEIADNAPESMLALKPLEVIWPMRIDGMSMTYSAPRSLSEPTPMVPQDTLRTSIFDLVSVIGRPAAIVTKSGRVLFANASAQDWLEGENRRLLASPAWVRRSAEQLDAEHSGETSPHPTEQATALAPGKQASVSSLQHTSGPVKVDQPDLDLVAVVSQLIRHRQRVQDRVGHFAVGRSRNTVADDLPPLGDGNDVVANVSHSIVPRWACGRGIPQRSCPAHQGRASDGHCGQFIRHDPSDPWSLRMTAAQNGR